MRYRENRTFDAKAESAVDGDAHDAHQLGGAGLLEVALKRTGDVSCRIAAFWTLWGWSRRPAWPENPTRAS